MKEKMGAVDGISIKMLKTISNYVNEPLAIIFNLCIKKSTWPDALKS